MIEDILQKVTPRQFFIFIGSSISLALLVALSAIIALVISNYNVLEWME